MTKAETEFEKARKLYPGRVAGFAPEWRNFRKNYGMKIVEIIPLLVPAIETQIAYRKACKKEKMWHAEWKDFKSWLHPNNQYWTLEVPVIKSAIRIDRCQFCPKPATFRLDGQGARCSSSECIAKYNLL